MYNIHTSYNIDDLQFCAYNKIRVSLLRVTTAFSKKSLVPFDITKYINTFLNV